MAAGVEANYIVAAAAALAGSLPSITGEGTDEEGTGAHVAAGQVREAALRLLVDIAKCVDFEKVPRAVDHFRSALVARSLGAAKAAHDGLGARAREQYMDEINLCEELLKMFG